MEPLKGSLMRLNSTFETFLRGLANFFIFILNIFLGGNKYQKPLVYARKSLKILFSLSMTIPLEPAWLNKKHGGNYSIHNTYCSSIAIITGFYFGYFLIRIKGKKHMPLAL